MPESPIQAVTDETQDVVVSIAWKPLLKKAAAYTAAALLGAGIYAIVTRPTSEDVEVTDEPIELTVTPETE